jgi:hypothetical protein
MATILPGDLLSLLIAVAVFGVLLLAVEALDRT